MLTKEEGLLLGLDLSTQRLKAILLQASDQRVVHMESVQYDKALPAYQTVLGMHCTGEGGRVTSPVMMWIEAMDLLFASLDRNLLSRVIAVSGSGQQHGSVYWNERASAALASLDPTRTLAENLRGVFAIKDSPIWADSSTEAECQALEEAAGGAEVLSSLTGSRAYCRFTGNQIAKIARIDPAAYQSSCRISLVSSFLASLLVGCFAPIDVSDGSGMNLMGLKTHDWVESLLETTAPGLRAKLGDVVDSYTSLGTISPYFARRYGLGEETVVVACTGDNPSSICGMRLSPQQPEGGDVVVSLGTSDTLLGLTTSPRPCLEGHVLVSPRCSSEYMVMLCYKNSSVAREAVRDRHCHGTWEAFSHALTTTPPGNHGQLALYLLLEEITPQLNHRGIFRINGDDKVVDSFGSPEAEVRAVVEGRFLSMRYHAADLGIAQPRRVLATGGASANQEMMQVLADVFGAPVFKAEVTDSAALGAALRAGHGLACERQGELLDFSSVAGSASLEPVALPSPGVTEKVYNDALLQRYARFEKDHKL